MSSLAQEESRSISENVTWGHRKRFTVNFLTKETKDNEGEMPQYYVEHNHEAIISPQIFDWVQEGIKRRREGKKRYSGVSIFSSKIKCGDCDGWYGAKVCIRPTSTAGPSTDATAASTRLVLVPLCYQMALSSAGRFFPCREKKTLWGIS